MIGKYGLLVVLIAAAILSACTAPTPTQTPEVTEEPAPTPEPTEEPGEVGAVEGVAELQGEIELSQLDFLDVYFKEPFVLLQDLTGFIQRDFLYPQPVDPMVLGPVTISEDGTLTYVLKLPAQPTSPVNDVDNDGQEEELGVQVWQVAFDGNFLGSPFPGPDEFSGLGWAAYYTSARVDAENQYELKGGRLVIWAPDDQQEFPTGWGDDNLLFTEDDPVGPVPAGYSVVDLEQEPFEIVRDATADLRLYEGDLNLKDYSQMGWSEAFETMFEQISREYPFTELKDVDWDALHDEFGGRVADAEAQNDAEAYYLALRDFAWSIPDGHVGLGGGDDFGIFARETAGGYGMAITGADDGRVLVNFLMEDGPAAQAGIQWGAEIVEWNGTPIAEAVSAVVPYSSPFSLDIVRTLQQYRYLVRAPLGAEVEVSFQNPGAGAPQTVTLTAVDERESFTRTSFYYNFDTSGLPLQYEILPSGYGYVKILSYSDDLTLLMRVWQRAMEVFIANEVPGIIIDIRQNGGGQPLGAFLAGYFVTERMDIARSYYYSESTGDFETFGPPSFTEPATDGLHYDGNLAVLVGPACASACEDSAHVLSLLPQTRVIGYYPSNGIFGEVGRGQYLLPGDYSFQIPTGMDMDMEGNLVIEGTGVVPDVDVPIDEDTLRREYLEGEDVVLNTAIAVMNQPIGAGITPAAPPTLTSDFDLIAEAQGGADFLEDLAQESYDQTSQAGETYLYTIPLSTSRDVIWNYAWCTTTADLLEDNWSKIQFTLTINGEEIPLSDLGVLEENLGGQECRLYFARLGDWSVGENVVVTSVTFTAPLNDGTADYPAGAHTYEYHVYIAREG